MPTVADFVIFSEFSFSLKIGTQVEKTLQQEISDIPVSGQSAILTWNKRVEISNGRAVYQVKMNGKLISQSDYEVTSSDWSAFQLNLGTNIIQPGNNTIQFRVTGGRSTLSIANAILWYRKNI